MFPSSNQPRTEERTGSGRDEEEAVEPAMLIYTLNGKLTPSIHYIVYNIVLRNTEEDRKPNKMIGKTYFLSFRMSNQAHTLVSTPFNRISIQKLDIDEILWQNLISWKLYLTKQES